MRPSRSSASSSSGHGATGGAAQLKALSPLEAAIAYTREAADRADPTDRRKAIGLLARTLAAEGHDSLAASTTTVAWSDTPPSPASARTLADEAEQTEVSGQT